MNLTIYTKNLIKKYGSRTVVNNVSFQVSQGEIVGLLGPNGAGKTTSFYQVVGLVRPDEGDVFLNDINITKLPMYKRAQMGIGYLPQEASVFRKLSVEDNIGAILEMTKLNKSEQKAKLEELLDEFRLQHVRKNNGDTLSGGERRRTEIARALAVDPKFILLDEPFAGVDPIAVEDIQSIVAKLKFRQIGILITDHNVNETLSICDRAYLLIDGKIFKHGTAEELAGDEQVRRLYLGRNFELKRKDYLHDEAEKATFSTQPTTQKNPTQSLLPFTKYIQTQTDTALNAIKDQTGSGLNFIFSDYFRSYNELKDSLKLEIEKTKSNNSKKVLEKVLGELPDLNYNNYSLFFKTDSSQILSGRLWWVIVKIRLSGLVQKLYAIKTPLGNLQMQLTIEAEE
ncbi:MAG TPA: LPS export ABC transporter ATP-binding protein [Ferruginibacter sp.]|nr:LPS export ABC transporter ATP-binding protein [Ferruginibacter sp.]